MLKKNLTNILLIVIIVILGLLFFKNNIQTYFKTKRVTKEVLSRIDINNIPDVAEACFYFNQDRAKGVEAHIDTYQRCEDEVEKYWLETDRWENLIKQNRDLDCDDFESGKDARMFYHYVSGELAKGYEETQRTDGKLIVRIIHNNLYNGHCRYDPYGLDTNGDCNACENYQ